jgi:hypothetical protein
MLPRPWSTGARRQGHRPARPALGDQKARCIPRRLTRLELRRHRRTTDDYAHDLGEIAGRLLAGV